MPPIYIKMYRERSLFELLNPRLVVVGGGAAGLDWTNPRTKANKKKKKKKIGSGRDGQPGL